MISCNIPLFIVVVFLLTLGVGIYFSNKATSFREYAIGKKIICYGYLSSYCVGILYMLAVHLMSDVEYL